MTRKFIRVPLLCLLGAAMISLSSCEKDEDYTGPSTGGTTNTSKVTPPTFEKNLSTTDLDGFSVRARFNNGGDATDNMRCTLHWKAYSSKPAKTPTARSLTESESMRVYASTKRSTTFDKSHAGYGGGTYVYYYMECSNSKYTTTTDITYKIVRRR